MTSKRNVFDGLNANRTRRGASSLDDLERTLNGLEARMGGLGSRPEPAPAPRRDDYAERFQQLGVQFSQRDDRAGLGVSAYARPAAPQAPAHSLSRLAHDIEQARREEESFNGLNAVSAEINRLRADIRGLTEKPADRTGEILRREIEELKRNVSMLAREDTLRSVGRSWEAYEHRPLDSDPAFEKLAGRLEEIQNAVDGLPQSLSLQSLEEKVRVLATALDGLSRQNPGVSAEHLEIIESRLDEISRAIVASSVSAPAMSFDHTPFDRIEARLSALSERVEEIAADDSAITLAEHMATRIAGLSEQFDEMARASALPEEHIARLAAQIDTISRKISEKPAEPSSDVMIQGLENRLYEIASAIDKKSRDATDQTLVYFRDLEGRLQELTQRIEDADAAPPQQNPEILELINSRFADFYHKVDEKQKKSAGQSVDTGIIRDLEAQVKNLSLQLDRPAAPMAEFNDISPRLSAIETSLSANREALLDAARRAAEDAIRNMALPQANPGEREAVLDLANDLKSLEAMARKADDRNSRTFEAIHDTLLKIVDRLSTIEVDTSIPMASRAAVLASSTAIPARSMDFGADIPALEPEERMFEPEVRQPARAATRSPAAAAAAAAAAAEQRKASAPEPAPKPSLFEGIARAARGEPRIQPKLAGDPSALAPEVSPFDSLEANQPLEPGSGAPDLNSIMKRVREERQSRSDSSGSDNVVKSDLIAAARRAAQAAAAEAEILKKASGKIDPVKKSGMADLVSRQRKPLFMAIGAVIVALAGLQLGKAYFAGEPETSMAEAPAVLDEKAPAEPASASAEPAASADSSVRVIDKPGSGSDAMMAAPDSAEIAGISADKPAASAPDATEASAMPADPKPMDAPMAADSMGQAPDEMAKAPVADVKPNDVKAGDAKPVMNAELPPVDAGPIALREAAASGDAKAFFEIASRYADGRGVEKDMKEAAKYYTKAADTGFAPAQFRIGSFYEKGLGVERDAQKAKTWYQLSAEQGNSSAMHNLAVLFAMGASGPVDNDSAALWFTKAAEYGVKDSQYNLGILAAKGLGVKQNLEDSYKWFALAAKAGDKDAASKRDEIANAMRPEQLARARATTDLWKAKDADAAVNTVEVPDSWRESAGQTASVGAKVDMKKAIRNIQLILAKNGYDAGSPDGVMGGKTTKAIAAYQAANGMKSTGEVDEALVRSLLAKAK